MKVLPFLPTACLVVLGTAISGAAAESSGVTRYYDEAGMRHLTLEALNGGQVAVRVRWAASPGAAGTWLGQGARKEGQLQFAAVVEEGQDRGTYFIARGEAKLEVQFRPNQKMPQDPGIVGSYRHISDEKHLQLVRKEFQAAEDRLATAIKTGSRTWPSPDRPAAADWKGRWPALLGRWMKIAYQPKAAPAANPGPPPLTKDKERPAAETDANYWLKLGEATSLAYSFMEPVPDGKSQESWDGDYSDGFGGSVSLRRAADGRLRVSLSCTRVNELHGADLQGSIPADAVKDGKAGTPATAEAVFTEAELPESSKEVRVILKRKGSFLWVETRRKQAPPGRLSWFDGIYRWSPVPVEQ